MKMICGIEVFDGVPKHVIETAVEGGYNTTKGLVPDSLYVRDGIVFAFYVPNRDGEIAWERAVDLA